MQDYWSDLISICVSCCQAWWIIPIPSFWFLLKQWLVCPVWWSHKFFGKSYCRYHIRLRGHKRKERLSRQGFLKCCSPRTICFRLTTSTTKESLSQKYVVQNGNYSRLCRHVDLGICQLSSRIEKARLSCHHATSQPIHGIGLHREGCNEWTKESSRNSVWSSRKLVGPWTRRWRCKIYQVDW